MKREYKIGIFGTIALVIFYFGFNYLKGSDLFATNNEYYVYYNDATGLGISSPVIFNGVKVGRVLGMDPVFDENKVMVTLAISKKIELSSNALAILIDDGLLGGKMIRLKLFPGGKLNADNVIKGSMDMGMIDELTGKVEPTLKNVDTLTLAITKLINDFQYTGTAVKALLGSASQTTAGVNGLVASNAQNVNKVISDVNHLTQNLNNMVNDLNSQLKPVIGGVKSTTDSLNKLQLNQTVQALNATISDLNSTVKNINKGQGTLGKLTTNDSLYTNLENTTASLNTLLVDLKANPKRYVHFSLWGGKKPK
ncbi:MAG: MlaD family protein [Leadbetterella sp.]